MARRKSGYQAKNSKQKEDKNMQVISSTKEKLIKVGIAYCDVTTSGCHILFCRFCVFCPYCK